MSDGAADGVSASASRLRGLAQRPAETPREAAEEQCDLCGESIPPQHRHLIDVQDRRLLCACRACSILFDHRGAGGGHFRLLPDRSRYVEGFELDDMLWQNLRIPVDLAFFFHSSAAGRVVAFYPAPIGATESLLELDAWEELVAANPVLEQLEPDVEALLVDRTRGARDHWLVPIDRCYELVGVIRTRWKGFGGGPDVWEEISRFFDGLRREAKLVHNGRKETT
jgi:Family of unknown function (DUF5947)